MDGTNVSDCEKVCVGARVTKPVGLPVARTFLYPLHFESSDVTSELCQIKISVVAFPISIPAQNLVCGCIEYWPQTDTCRSVNLHSLFRRQVLSTGPGRRTISRDRDPIPGHSIRETKVPLTHK